VPAGLKVAITRELIEQATERDSRHCMIAEAIKEVNPRLERVIVDLQTIRWTNPRTHKRYVCLTPEKAALALVAFDQGEEIEPFTLNLTPAQVTPTRARVRDDGTELKRGEKADRQRTRTRERRGPKVLHVDDQGRVHVEGGAPLPTGHLSNVKISRNDVRLYGRRLLRA